MSAADSKSTPAAATAAAAGADSKAAVSAAASVPAEPEPPKTEEAIAAAIKNAGALFQSAQKMFISGSMNKAADQLAHACGAYEAIKILPADRATRIRLTLDHSDAFSCLADCMERIAQRRLMGDILVAKRRALELLVREFGVTSVQTYEALNGLITVLFQSGQVAECKKMITQMQNLQLTASDEIKVVSDDPRLMPAIPSQQRDMAIALLQLTLFTGSGDKAAARTALINAHASLAQAEKEWANKPEQTKNLEALRETVTLVTQTALASGISITDTPAPATAAATVNGAAAPTASAAAVPATANAMLAASADAKSGSDSAKTADASDATATAAGTAVPAIGGGVQALMTPAGVAELQKTIAARPEMQPLLLMTEARGCFSAQPPDLAKGAAFLEHAQKLLEVAVTDPKQKALQPAGLLASVCSQLSSVYDQLNRRTDALTSSVDAVKWCTQYAGAESPEMIGPLMSLSVAYQQLKQWEKAEPPLLRAIELAKLAKLSTGEPFLALSALYNAQTLSPKSIAAVESGIAYLAGLHPDIKIDELDVKSVKPDQFNVSGTDARTAIVTMKVALQSLQSELKTGVSPAKMAAAAAAIIQQTVAPPTNTRPDADPDSTAAIMAAAFAAANRRKCAACDKPEPAGVVPASPESKRSVSGVADVKFQRCSRCQSAYYCTPVCQANHWPTHKAECKAAGGDSEAKKKKKAKSAAADVD